MSKSLIIRIRRPQLITVLALAFGTSLAAVSWWLCRRYFSIRQNKSKSPQNDVIPPPILPTMQQQMYAQVMHGFSEKSISQRSKGSCFYPLSLHLRTVSREGSVVPVDAGPSLITSSTDCGRIGLRTLNVVIEILEECIGQIHEANGQFSKNTESSSSCEKFIAELQGFLETSYLIRERYKRVFILQETNITSTTQSIESLSEDDTTSFVSAMEQIDYSELELQLIQNFHRPLYRSALKEINSGTVFCRAVRTELMQCNSDVEYIAKLICVRQGFDFILSHEKHINWLTRMGRTSAVGLLTCLGYPTDEFEQSFVTLIDYLRMSCNYDPNSKFMDELRGKGIQTLNFYDILFDRLLLDAFETLGNPPSSILVLTRNNWLSNNFKRSALDSAVWTLMTAKRKMLQYDDGFFAAYYRVVEMVTPALAWGFLGPEETLNHLCESVRDELMLFLRSLFIDSDEPALNKSDQTVNEFHSSTDSLFADSVREYRVAHDNTNDDDDDDDVTVTEDDVGKCETLRFSPVSENYSGLRLTSIENLASGIYSNMCILERRVYAIMTEFSDTFNICIPDEIRQQNLSPNSLHM